MNKSFAALSYSLGFGEEGWTSIRQVIIYVESEIKNPIKRSIWITGEVLIL